MNKFKLNLLLVVIVLCVGWAVELLIEIFKMW